MMTELFDIQMSDVSETSLLTLYCHALESQSGDSIISDPKAVGIMRAVNQELSKSKNRLHTRACRSQDVKRARTTGRMRLSISGSGKVGDGGMQSGNHFS